ncbi:MAG: tetratricopeptide repeat protein [Phycisphaerae bacterium]|jgi:tetratricopeptide (TPR) repeat protein|nr:tetratricopeptide repeat protein [Phycisphaerae bacterium]
MTTHRRSTIHHSLATVRTLSGLVLTAGLVVGLAGCRGTGGRNGEAPIEASKRPEIVIDPTPEQEVALVDANTKTDAGSYDEAIALFNDLLEDNPTLVDAHIGIGRTYEKMGDLEKAEPAYARAATLDIENFDAQFGHARVLSGLQRFTEAIRAFHRALVVRPESIEANAGMADAYLKLNQAQEALTFAEKAVELAKNDGEARVRLAVALERLNRNAEAIKAYEVALELVEPRDGILTSLVNLYSSEKRYVEAINTADELIRIAPSANAYERLGWAHFRMGTYDKSAEAYRKGVELDENHWPSLNGVATNALNRWLQSGRKDEAARQEARAAFQRSLRINQDQPKVVAIMTKYAP